MSMENFDLNLLRVFEALLAERQVTRAAVRLSLTPSAVSNALGRLRVQFGDELFVRTPVGMEPTVLALSLAEPMTRALEAARLALSVSQPFEAATSTTRFTLGLTDYAEFALAPLLVSSIRAEAPSVSLTLRHADHDNARELVESDVVDAAIGVWLEPPSHMTRIYLIRDDFGVLMRAGHPALQHNWDLDRFLAHPHLLVSSAGSRDGIVDRVLAKQGLSRDLAVVVAHLMVAGPLVAQSDLFCTMGCTVGTELCRAYGLQTRPLPLQMEPMPLTMVFHNRHASRPAHQWLRRKIAQVARQVGRERKDAGEGSNPAD
jgi:DNA-binding transcriptional LysR family regulator